jgi:hypothetical protein
MALRAGQEIDAFCTKCKMDLLHRIVAVMNDKPVKVECRTCYQTHVYRAPKSSPAARIAAASQTSTTGRSSGGAAPKPARKPSIEDDAAVVPPPGARIHSYRMTERYMKDQWIVHKNFGTGVVTSEVGPDKIEVRFDGGLKVLVHGWTE